MKNLKEFGLLILIAVLYFTAVYFAVAALFPTLALQAGLLAAMAAMAIYLVLVLLRRDEEGLLLGLLILSPFICLVAGAAWWLLRLLSLWDQVK